MKRLMLVLATLTCLLLPAAPALAYNPLGAACGNKAHPNAATNKSSACSPTHDPLIGSNGIIRKVANIVAVIGGVAGVILIIVGGMEFVTSGGDAEKAAGARKTILGAVIGLIIIAVAEGIVVFILKWIK